MRIPKSRLAAVLVAAPVVAAAAYMIWLSIDTRATTARAASQAVSGLPVFLEHYDNGRYEAALADAQTIETADYRTPLFLAATHGQLGRLDEARRALSELDDRWTGPASGIRQDLLEHQAYPPELVERLMEGLRKAGFDAR